MNLRGTIISASIFLGSLVIGFSLGGSSKQSGETSADSSLRKSSRISALNPSGGNASVTKAQKLDLNDPEWRFLLRQMPVSDFPAMADYLVDRYQANTNEMYFSRHFGPLLEIWGERDPAAAVAWYENEMPKQFDHHVRGNLFLGWARVDGEAALTYIDEAVSGTWPAHFVNQAFSGMGESDPNLAARLLMSRSAITNLNWTQACFQMGRHHPESCYAFLKSVPPSNSGRHAGFLAMFNGMKDGGTMKKYWEQLEGDDADRLSHSIEKKLAQFRVANLSGDEFLELTREEASGSARNISWLTQAMVESNPEELARLIISGNEKVTEHLHFNVSSALVRGHSFGDAALRSIYREIFANPRSGEHVKHYFEPMGQLEHRRDFGFGLLDELKGDVRVRASAALIGGIASQSVESALDVYADIEDDEARAAAELAIAEKWSSGDSQAAIEWVQSGELAVDEMDAMEAILPNWASQDGAAASEWITSLSQDEPRRAELIGKVVSGMMETEELPREALALLNSIEDPAQREETREQLRDGRTLEEFEADVHDPGRDDDEGIPDDEVPVWRELLFGS